MHFVLTDEQKMLRDMVRDFAQSEISPAAGKLDEDHEFPLGNLKRMAENGLMGIPIPEEYGGAGADFLSYVLAIEEISRADASHGVILAVHTSVGTFPILYFGTEEQKRKYIPKLASGDMLGAFALTEPNAGSDVSGIATTAVKTGEHYVLNGTKRFITNGGYAGVYTVFAITDKSKKSGGISAFLVDKDTPGFKIGKVEKKMGLNASSTTELIFEDAAVPAENLLGKKGEGIKVALSCLDGGRVGIGAQGLGIAQAALDAALAYAKDRKQFGRHIIDFQAIQFMLADMATQVEAARLLVYQAANLRMLGLPYSKEAAMAKMYATDTAMKVTTDAVQIFGGYGYCSEYPVERYMRDAKVTQIYEGTNQIQRIVIARNLVK